MKRFAETCIASSIWLTWFLLASLTAGFIISLVVPARAQQHSLADPSHWYPMECCSMLDCAPVDNYFFLQPIDGQGLPSAVVTSKHGTAVVPHNFPRRASKDGRMHVCMRPNGALGTMNVLCVFDPPGL